MAYPNKSKVVRHWTRNSPDSKSIVPKHDNMQSHSLKIYLERYGNYLSTCKISNIATVTEEIMHIYQSLMNPYVQTDPMLKNDPFKWTSKDLFKVSLSDTEIIRQSVNLRTHSHLLYFFLQDMIKFLLSTVKKLDEIKLETPLENGRRMLSVITIMCCIWKMVSSARDIKLSSLLEHSSMSMFLRMLRLRPDQEQKRCIDWEYLDKNIPAEFKKGSYDSIRMFINELSSCDDPLSKPEWLYAIPVMDFLNGVSKPFQEFEFDPKKVPFGDTLIGLRAVKRKTYHKDNSL